MFLQKLSQEKSIKKPDVKPGNSMKNVYIPFISMQRSWIFIYVIHNFEDIIFNKEDNYAILNGS